MSFTKSKVIQRAFGQIGLANYVYDLDGGQIDEAYDLLDMMVYGWEANGIRIGWPISDGGNTSGDNRDELLPVPDYALEALAANLALRLANTLGKQIPPGLQAMASSSLGNLANQTAIPTPQREMPNTMPLGQGNKPWRNFNSPFVRQKPPKLLAGSDNELEFTE